MKLICNKDIVGFTKDREYEIYCCLSNDSVLTKDDDSNDRIVSISNFKIK